MSYENVLLKGCFPNIWKLSSLGNQYCSLSLFKLPKVFFFKKTENSYLMILPALGNFGIDVNIAIDAHALEQTLSVVAI